MDRRNFVITGAVSLASLLLTKVIPFTGEPTPIPLPIAPATPLTIGSILKASHHNIVKELIPDGQDVVDESLQKKLLHVVPLAPLTLYKGEHYEVKELAVPHVWTQKDEDDNPTEDQKIAFVAAIAENGINSMDDYMLYEYPNHRFILSREYRYHMGDVYETHADDSINPQKAYIAVMSRAFVAIPESEYER